MSTLVTYFVPEDKEVQDKPNAFIIYKDVKQVKLSDITSNFPMPGTYYFRFKFKLDNKNIWIDFNNVEESVPRYEDKIVMKVSRINWEDSNANNNLDEFSNSNTQSNNTNNTGFPDIMF